MGVNQSTPDAACPECTFIQDRYETGPGQHVLLEPRYEPPAHTVPAGYRWVTHPDRTATNTGDTQLPAGTLCRIPHNLVCPCNEEPSGPPVLKALWQHNSGLITHFDPQVSETS
ncbi:DUF6083 domain-containing protein [Streptomyces sp. NPDC051173]|uniref:DUF6083 domain-containing protein n=1 Tax=Streptomyces sp. NPDC051173 TaxID=3155164 RepID=UPI00344B420C